MDNFEETLEDLISNTPSVGDTSLAAQIKHMEVVNKVFTTPLGIAIINSLKELQAIKHKTLNA